MREKKKEEARMAFMVDEIERGRRIAQRMVKSNRTLAMVLVGHGGLTHEQIHVVRDDYGLHVSWGHGLHVSWGQLVPASASVRNRAALAELCRLLDPTKKRGGK